MKGIVLANYLYEVRLDKGRSHPEHSVFHENVSALNGKSGDFGGINAVCVISHRVDEKTLHLLCTNGMNSKDDVSVEEITKKTLDDPDDAHHIFTDLIEKYFLPYGDYPNIN